MFDGADEDAVAFAREQWKRAAAAVTATYWRQDSSGRWEKAAESTGAV
jgi:DNA polymerase-3 subunit chi